MKRYNFLLVIFTSILTINIYAQNYGLDNADPSVFTKYRVPDTDLRSLWFNTSLNLNTIKQNYLSSAGRGSQYNSRLTYYLNPYYYLLQESDSRYLNFNANINSSYNYNYTEGQSSFDQYVNNTKQNGYSANMSLSFTDNNYKDKGNAFYSIASTIQVRMSDLKNDRNYDGKSSSTYSSTKTQSYIISFGIGMGKMRNVTSVVSAIRFQERLKQVNLLNTNLSDKTIEDLAQQFSRQSYYGQVHVRPDKYFWQGIENILAGDGVSMNGLNMYADAYLRETTNEIRFLRQEGFMTGINLQFNYHKYYSAPDNFYLFPEQFFTMGNVYLTYSHQLNLNSQVNFDVSVSGGPNVLEKPAIWQEYLLTANAGYNYELTDRLVASLKDGFSWNYQKGDNFYRYLENDMNLSFNYFIEDDISLNATYQWSYLDARTIFMSNIDNHSTNSVSVGLTYYIDRGMLIR